MKTIKNWANGLGKWIGLAAVAIMAAAIPMKAQAQVGLQTRYGYPYSAPNGSLSGLSVSNMVVTNATSLALPTNWFPVFRDRGMSFLISFSGAGASTANITFNLNVSADGTNWSNTNPIQIPIPLQGTGTGIFYTNISKTVFDNVRWAQITSITNAATNNATIQWIEPSVFP